MTIDIITAAQADRKATERRKPNTSLDCTIVRRYRRGLTTSQIADDLIVSIHFVRSRLLANGVDMSVRQTGHKINEMWALDEGDRRIAIARKAAKGARKALAAIYAQENAGKRGKSGRKAGIASEQSGTLREQNAVVAGSKSLGRETPPPLSQAPVSAGASSTAERKDRAAMTAYKNTMPGGMSRASRKVVPDLSGGAQ
ncbi:hypothetical protein NO932_11685 [Pelagibacterium sp. 26DY04]|uniref:hypothetical protein n=1 Tax=Pelagibacterium sp. 26DY04 TaxID=2967130 RepID=UPI002815844F|nr:hypothetical protein [Pelagibacterium sp. 26DY04]WMT85589.1 hypothetical protein NO932_11685 [Pelagibacterium sp. 26DY04]